MVCCCCSVNLSQHRVFQLEQAKRKRWVHFTSRSLSLAVWIRTISALFSFLVFFAWIAHVYGDGIRLCFAPFEIQTKTDVIIVRGKFPEDATTFLVSRNADLMLFSTNLRFTADTSITYGDGFSAANFNHSIFFLSKRVFEFFDIFSRPHIPHSDLRVF